MIIGITGGIGSGKTTVVNMFSQFKNIAVYFADDEAKKLMNSSSEIRTKLITVFGEATYSNNQLNKAYLANIVFKEKEKLNTLNNIVHPIVHKHFQNFIQEHSHKHYVLYENAILFENGSNLLCDKIITVTAPETIRIQRVLKRDNTTIEAVKNRIKNQWDDSKKKIQSHYIINNQNINKTKEEVLRIHNILTKTSK